LLESGSQAEIYGDFKRLDHAYIGVLPYFLSIRVGKAYGVVPAADRLLDPGTRILLPANLQCQALGR
jgi:hypothetical protein